MNDQILDALLHFNISISEYHLLSIIDREGQQHRSGLSKYAFNYYMEIDPFFVRNEGEYEKAIDLCLEKQFIKVLSKYDCQKDIKRWEKDDNQFVSEIEYTPYNIDFTEQGEKLYRQIDKKIGRNRFESIEGYKWCSDGMVSVFTKHKKNIVKTISNIRENPLYLFNKNEEIIEIGKPYQIGPWWVSRFCRLDTGWRVDIKYLQNLE